MKFIALLLVIPFSVAALSACGQASADSVRLGKGYAEQELKASLSDKSLHNVVSNKELLIKDKTRAIAIAEQITFGVYGKDNIIRQRPYEAFLSSNY